jgi:hypothetical protein
LENSNCGDQCAFVNSGFCKCDKECPFYTESWWENVESKQPKLVKDCSPKKMMLEQNQLLHRFLCMQSVVEDVRNRMDRIEAMLLNLTSQSKEFLIEKSQESLESRQNRLQQIEIKKEEKS